MRSGFYMKSWMSGWSQRIVAIMAPHRAPTDRRVRLAYVHEGQWQSTCRRWNSEKRLAELLTQCRPTPRTTHPGYSPATSTSVILY
jgi:hypothetical protein